MKRRFFALVTSFILLIPLQFTPVFANSVESPEAVYSVESPEINDPVITPYAYVELSRTLVSTTPIIKKPIGYARNQQENGVVFIGAPGSIYYSDGGPSVQISLGAALDFATVGVSLGKKESGVTGYGLLNLAPNIPWKLFIYKDLSIKKYKIEYDYYGARGVKYDYMPTTTRIYLEARVVY